MTETLYICTSCQAHSTITGGHEQSRATRASPWSEDDCPLLHEQRMTCNLTRLAGCALAACQRVTHSGSQSASAAAPQMGLTAAELGLLLPVTSGRAFTVLVHLLRWRPPSPQACDSVLKTGPTTLGCRALTFHACCCPSSQSGSALTSLPRLVPWEPRGPGGRKRMSASMAANCSRMSASISSTWSSTGVAQTC